VWIILAWKSISPEVTLKGFLRSAAHPMQWMGMMICCGIAVRWECKECVQKMKALTVNMEQVTLIGTGGWNMTCFVY
jgi:hypothetical protein